MIPVGFSYRYDLYWRESFPWHHILKEYRAIGEHLEEIVSQLLKQEMSYKDQRK